MPFIWIFRGFRGEARGVELLWIGEVPVQIMQALPYVLTVVLLAGFIGKAKAPGAIGVPYSKEG